jgi:hypothetical protein
VPPPGACEVVLLDFFDDELAGAVSGVVEGAVADGLVLAVLVDVVDAADVEPQVPTPPWPRHAPERDAPENEDPSLQVAVTLAGVCA